jgi:hypothetical protein
MCNSIKITRSDEPLLQLTMTHSPYQSLFHSGGIPVVTEELLEHNSASKRHQHVAMLRGFVLIPTEEFTADLGNVRAGES